MWGSRRYVEMLERELAEWKTRYAESEARNKALTNTMFVIQGAPAPFEEPRGEDVMEARPSWEQFRDQLEAEAAVVAARVDDTPTEELQ
jgi:hypothetical protein